MSAGVLIALEGPEGSGKSTQIARLKDRISADRDVVFTREPGGTPLANEIRSLILSNEYPTADVTEFLLLAASRAQHVQEVIRPALARGAVIFTDRFTGASEAYQGFGRGLDLDFIRKVNAEATNGVTPELTLLFDVHPSIGLERASERGDLDRLESADMDFHERVYEGFRKLAVHPAWRVIDGNRSEDEVFEDVWSHVERYVS